MADEQDMTLASQDARPYGPDDAQPLLADGEALDGAVEELPQGEDTDPQDTDDGPLPGEACVDASDSAADDSSLTGEDEVPLDADEIEDPTTIGPATAQGPSAGASQGEPSSQELSTTPMPTATIRLPAVVEAPDRDEPSPADDPRLSDVGATFAGWLRGRGRAVGAFVSSHRLLLTLACLACVAAVLAIVLFGIDASKMPPDDLIKEDAQIRLAPPAYTVGDFADDDPLVLSTIEIESKQNSGMQRDAFEVDVLATFTNPGMETQAEGMLTYVRKGDDWSCIEATVGNASHHATAGVSQQRVLAQIDTLLQKADTSVGSEPLSALYHGATVEIVGENFNEEAQTDSLILHCSSSGTFVSYECDLTVHFRFAPASGAWELVEAIVSDGARDLGFGPLLGTWRGTFASQKSSSAKCLAARDTGLTISVTRAAMTDDGSAVIEGTVTGTAHLHPDLEEDAQSTEGDLALEAVPFAGKLSSGDVEQDVIGLLAGNNPKRNAAGIVFDCTTQDVAGGDITLTLEFGQANAPDAATATLTTTHTYEDTFLLVVSYKREARFADSFTLEKVS